MTKKENIIYSPSQFVLIHWSAIIVLNPALKWLITVTVCPTIITWLTGAHGAVDSAEEQEVLRKLSFSS